MRLRRELRGRDREALSLPADPLTPPSVFRRHTRAGVPPAASERWVPGELSPRGQPRGAGAHRGGRGGDARTYRRGRDARCLRREARALLGVPEALRAAGGAGQGLVGGGHDLDLCAGKAGDGETDCSLESGESADLRPHKPGWEGKRCLHSELTSNVVSELAQGAPGRDRVIPWSSLKTDMSRDLGSALLWTECFCPPPPIHAETLPPSMMAAGGGASGRRFGPEDGAPTEGMSALRKGTLESSFCPSTA